MAAASALRNPWVWGLLALLALVGYAVWRAGTYARERMKSPFKYFAWSEFDSPDQPGSGQRHMSESFIRKLDRIRDAVGFPLIINSGYRTVEHNRKVGGAANSAHLRGYAADIRAITDAQKRAIAKAAIAEGITRIGWGRTFIHLDVDPSLGQRTVWGYPGTTPPPFNSLA